MKNFILLACLGMLSQIVFAQEFEITLELKPRFENRHGFKTLVPDDFDAATFVSQRSRLNLKYGSEQLDVYLSLQNVRVWGDVNTLSASDINGTAIHEAWAKVRLDSLFSLKIGRQEIVYDDSRIFGNVDWAQTGRSHDAFIASYQPNTTNRLEVGLALNAPSETLFKVDYDVNNYKSFQYAWYHTQLSNFGLSFLALNTGFAFENDGEQDVDYQQTFGTFLSFSRHKIKADISSYFQTGKIANQELNAYNFAGNIHYDLNTKLNIGAGVEYLSGTDMNSTSDAINSFNPFFGTNHKFNGWMDYFYVGNHINSVGLLDFYLPLNYHQVQWSIQLIPHVFSATANIIDDLGTKKDAYLGTELDAVFAYKISNSIDFQMGYSQMFATESMEALKGGNKDATTNWAWAMFVFKPNLFSYTK